MLRRMFTEWNPWILTDRILYKAGLDIWDFLILIAGTAIVGWVSRVGNKIDLHRNFVSQSWLYRAVIILAMLGVWYLFGVYGPECNPVDFIYFNF